MALYAIGDLHLSLGSYKPMDIFGGRWENHTEKLVGGFSTLTSEDTCVICGDVSWAMSLEDALEDFLFVHNLPGKKIILKGNHDYWWATRVRLNRFFEKHEIDSIEILHNNCFFYRENYAVCGTRGWFYEEESQNGHDKKIMAREIARLETSLRAAADAERYVFLHYPPVYREYMCGGILDLFEKYSVKVCCYGHIHSHGCRSAFEGMLRDTRHIMVSADHLSFIPRKILD